MRLVLAVLIPVIGGLAAALGQAPWDLWWLALGGYALGLWAVARARWPFLAAWLFGAAHFGLALNWITEPFFVNAAATAFLAPVALGASAFGFGLFWAFGGWAGRRLLGGALGAAVGLALLEIARSYVLTGFPWALPGHILIGTDALAAASLAGAHGLGIAVLVGAGLAATLRPAAMATGAVIWALPFGYAATLPPAPPADGPVIRLVQPNAPQHLKWDPDWINVFFRRGLEETAAPGDPVATIWPETSLPELLRYSQDIRPMIAAASGGTPVVAGAQRYGEDGRPRNSLVVLTGDGGEIDLVHDKHRLVPFGEYLPFPALFETFGIGPMAAQLAGIYAPGAGPRLIDLPGIGPVLPMICYEAIFPQDIRRVDRPRAILHLTNDAWFGTRAGPQQHLALARLRAAESGLPLLRAANTGVSAAIDARGDVLAALALGDQGHVDAALPGALPPTIYARVGDALAMLLLSALATLLFAVPRGNRLEPSSDRP
ncbi:MAG: apolipoprotein N-acyltransferase [Pseudomonadota bacterium]